MNKMGNDKAIVSVCLGCYADITQIVWLKQEAFIFSQLWRLEDQGARVVGFW